MKLINRQPHSNLRAIASACTLVALGGCGGNEPGQTASGPGANQFAAVVASTEWTRCAVEGATCNVSGTKQVRYGAGYTFVTRTVSAPVACTNAVFGDPVPGVDKVCDQRDVPATAPVLTWTQCATEGGTCTVSGTRQVRYGANGTFTTRSVTGSVSCTNGVFGDPLPGVNKVCQFSSSTSTAPTPTPTPTPTPAPVGGALVTDAIFAPTSFWYKPIPASVPLHANSANFVREFIRQRNTYYGNVTINTAAYASPVYVAAAGAPTTRVAVWDCQGKGYLDQNLAAQWTAVPIPASARPSAGTDGEMTVYQPSTNTMWEFWQTTGSSGQWKACWGGQLKAVSTSSGIWPSPYGTTATGLPFVGGQITAEELQRGEIRHVIGIALVDLENWNVVSWPANRSDGSNPGGAANRIPEGTRFRLDPAVNVDALNITPAAKTIARAAQKYGFVVWDKAGAISLRAQNVTSYTSQGKANPYPALFSNKPDYQVLDGFPWDRLQFMPKDYGKQ